MSGTKFKCWEFCGSGDRFFGGAADDRVLYQLTDGTLKFLRGCDAWCAPYAGSVHALFDSQEAAETAGIATTERHGLISGIRA